MLNTNSYFNNQYTDWNILIYNPDSAISKLIRDSIDGIEYSGKPLKIFEASTLKEAKFALLTNKKLVLAIIDIDYDLYDSHNLLTFIRNDLENSIMRLILTSSEKFVTDLELISTYSVNDIRILDEYTLATFPACITSQLNNYKELYVIRYKEQSFKKIIDSSHNIYQFHSIKNFASMMLIQLFSIFNMDDRGLIDSPSAFLATKLDNQYCLLAGSGKYSDCIDSEIKPIVSDDDYNLIYNSITTYQTIYEDNKLVLYFKNESGIENIIFIDNIGNLTPLDLNIANVLCDNISIAYDNIHLHSEIANTQKEIIFTLGEISEARSKETGHHVRRVAEYSKLLAKKYGLSPAIVSNIQMASPMHDIGKLAIPDSILNKPGKLTYEEFETMKTHSLAGYDMLKNSNKTLMNAAAIIALEHHEKFDGSGYPYGKVGKEISIEGRITAIADVFDALGSDRVYKKAWTLDAILELFKEERGKHFDPDLIDIFLNNLNEFLEIRDRYKEPS